MIPKPCERVNTPIGPGYIECRWKLGRRKRCMVRVQINDKNREHLLDPNCWTPSNQIFGMFIFDASDVGKDDSNAIRNL
jgi:hypothetical protein